MKICCLSDVHGILPQIPECDLLLLAGDYCPTKKSEQYFWFITTFKRWLDECTERCDNIVGVAGNHDWAFEKVDTQQIINLSLPWTYLQDDTIEYNYEDKCGKTQGLMIYGTPYQRRFYDWAFNLDEPELDKKFDNIPNDCDIILTHGPPFGIGDNTIHTRTIDGVEVNERIGSKRLRDRALEIKAKLVVYGHNHSGVGIYKVEDTVFVNASYVGENYQPNWKSPFIVEI